MQAIGRRLLRRPRYTDEIYKQIAQVPGIADGRIQQTFNVPTLYVNVNRSLASNVGLTEEDVATSLQDTLASSLQTAPTFWLNPKNGVSYPIVIQMPQYWVDTLDNLKNVPIAGDQTWQLLGGLATIKRGMSDAVVSHYDVQPNLDIYATTNGPRDLGSVAADVEKILHATAADAPPGSTVVVRGQVETMKTAYGQLFAGLAMAIVSIYLLIVVNFQSWTDPSSLSPRSPPRSPDRLDAVCAIRRSPFRPSPAPSCAWASRPPIRYW